MKKDIMIDLETLSNRPNAVILILAAIRFDRLKEIPLEDIPKEDIFYVKIKVKSCKEVGMKTNQDTINWWKRQSPEIIKEAFGSPRENLDIVLKRFSKWFGIDTEQKIWGNGGGFDCPILKEAYVRCSLEAPWKFWNERDTRTIYDLAGVKNSDLPNNSKHHALHDCYRQIVGIWMSMKRIQIN